MSNLIDKLVDEIGPGHMGSTAYDTAWAARLGEIDWDLSSRALAWLAETQLPNGAWGAVQPHAIERANFFIKIGTTQKTGYRYPAQS